MLAGQLRPRRRERAGCVWRKVAQPQLVAVEPLLPLTRADECTFRLSTLGGSAGANAPGACGPIRSIHMTLGMPGRPARRAVAKSVRGRTQAVTKTVDKLSAYENKLFFFLAQSQSALDPTAVAHQNPSTAPPENTLCRGVHVHYPAPPAARARSLDKNPSCAN